MNSLAGFVSRDRVGVREDVAQLVDALDEEAPAEFVEPQGELEVGVRRADHRVHQVDFHWRAGMIGSVSMSSMTIGTSCDRICRSGCTVACVFMRAVRGDL